MEARAESLLLRLVTHYRWTKSQHNDLGYLRQAIKFPRRCIRDDIPIPWTYSEHPQYLELKRVGSTIGAHVVTGMLFRGRTGQRAYGALRYITANDPHEENFENVQE